MSIRRSLAYVPMIMLLLSTLGFAAQRSHAAPDQPATRVNEPVTLEPKPSASPTPGTAEPNPFPATPTMTDTVMTAIADLAAGLEPPTPPDGALTAQLAMSDEVATASMEMHRLYLPFSRGGLRTTSQPSPTPAPAADVATAMWPTPSIRVIRGGILAYQVRLLNHGQGEASGVRLRIPYPRQQMTLISTSFAAGSGDWISAIETDAITVTFGPLAAGGRRTATLNFHVASNMPNETVIHMRGAHTWSDARSGGSGATNTTPILVGVGNADSAYLWLSATPTAGKAGTVHQFFTDRFIPGEGVIPWLNTPSGVRPLELRTTADNYGRISLNLATTGLAPGNYSLVVYGARSNLTGVTSFTVQP